MKKSSISFRDAGVVFASKTVECTITKLRADYWKKTITFRDYHKRANTSVHGNQATGYDPVPRSLYSGR